jgi:PAS domain S-box-containing protein
MYKASTTTGRTSNFSLAQKGALLVAVPVVVQLVLLSIFCFVRTDADGFARRAGHARDVSLAMREMNFRDVAIMVYVDDCLESNLVVNPACITELKRLRSEATVLKQLWEGSPENCGLIDRLTEGTFGLLSLIRDESAISHSKELLKQRNRLLKTNEEAHTTDAASGRPNINSQVANYENDLIHLLFTLNQPERLPAAKDTFEQAQSRRIYLVAAATGTVFNLLALFLMGLFLSRNIVERLNLLIENSLRLSNGQKLLPLLSGTDEIAQVDQGFHDMAASLTEAASKNQALFENAHDVLCYIDKSLCFSGMSMNRAATKVLGYEPTELIGGRVEDIVVLSDLQSTKDHLERIVSQGGRTPFEARICRKDGIVIQTLWTGRYVPDEGKVFCVIHDITGRKAAERLRKDVVQLVSHELFSPLSAISTIHSNLESGRFGEINDQGKRHFANIRMNLDRMLRLINDLLDIEKLEAGTLQLERADVSLFQIAQQSIGSVQFMAEKINIRLENNCPDLTINADSHRLVQVLVNLLSNALNFSPRGGKITITAVTTEDGVEISVTDEGRGVPPEMAKAIFNRFQQVKASDATVKGGSGLGLAICKALVELHGGQIAVESKSGQGSRFYFLIPV